MGVCYALSLPSVVSPVPFVCRDPPPRTTVMSEELVRTNCDHVGETKAVTKGHFAREVVPWLSLPIPGIIYFYNSALLAKTAYKSTLRDANYPWLYLRGGRFTLGHHDNI